MLRRETLELALYTFKYSPSVKSIVGLLPPAGNTNYAIYLRRRNFENELSKPLDATLPQHKVLSYQQLSPVEKATVDRLTMKNTYQSQFSQGANGRTLLVLQSVEPVASPALRRIPLLLCLAFVLTGSSAAQTQVGFLAVGDYGVGGSR